MEADSRHGRDPVLVLVAWDGPDREAAATRLIDGAVRRTVMKGPDDLRTRVSAALVVADRRLRGSAIAGGAAPGTLGVAIAVMQGDHVVTATFGPLNAYVVRDARLVRIGVEATRSGRDRSPVAIARLRAGDTLVLASRDLLRELGPEELRSAALAMHPVAAAQHLRRLFATSGGRGSSAVLVNDVGSQSASRRGRRIAMDDLPRRTTPARLAHPARRAALGLLSFVSVIAIVGLMVVVLPQGRERVSAGDVDVTLGAALATATDRVTRADNLAASDPVEALGLYRAAWHALNDTAPLEPITDAGAAALMERVQAGLDAAYEAAAPKARTLTTFDPDERDPAPGSFVRGPGGALYFIDRAGSVVTAVDPEDGRAVDIVHRGDEPDSGQGRVGRPVQLESASGTLLIIDDDARAWTWRPSRGDRHGTLAALSLGAADGRPASFGDIATYPDPNGFRLYQVDAEQRNIYRYQPTFDGRSFSRSEYLVNDDDAVAGFTQLHVDERVHALGEDGISRYEFGRVEHFRTELPPDDADIRPGTAYELMDGTDLTGSRGLLYVYDAAWDRIVVFDKVGGRYVRQWITGPEGPSLGDMLGLSVTMGTRKQPDTLHWLTPVGLFEAVVPSTATAAAGSAAAEDAKADRRRKGKPR